MMKDRLALERIEPSTPTRFHDGGIVQVTQSSDNLEAWLRRPYGEHERNAIDRQATGKMIPCPCARCTAERERLAANLRAAFAQGRGRRWSFEAWVESWDVKVVGRRLRIFFKLLAACALLGLGYELGFRGILAIFGWSR